eukprot:m.339356 g.339356  ORF g.339356 m.339356 type:complete len:735 (+) comp18773_c0_seq1:91-2295(+)
MDPDNLSGSTQPNPHNVHAAVTYCKLGDPQVRGIEQDRRNSQLDMETQHLVIQVERLQDELNELQQLYKAATSRTLTCEEQLSERAEALVRLNQKVSSLQHELLSSSEESAKTLETELEKQRERLLEDAQSDKNEELQRISEEMQRDKHEALQQLREQLEIASDNRLTTMLSEQQHDLQSEFSRKLSNALESLNRELSDREQKNLEKLRREMEKEQQRVRDALETRIRKIENRAAKDLQEAMGQSEIEREIALKEQKRELDAEARRERSAALEQLEANLTSAYKAQQDALRDQLLRKHADELSTSRKQIEERLKKKFKSEHTSDKRSALTTLERELKAEWAKEREDIISSLQRKHKSEIDATITETQKKASKRAYADMQKEKRLSLSQQRKQQKDSMAEDYMASIENLKKRHQIELQEAVSKERESISTKLRAEFNKEKRAALESQRKEMFEKVNGVGSVISNLKKQHQEEMKDALAKERETVKKRVEREWKNKLLDKTKSIASTNLMVKEISELKNKNKQLSEAINMITRQKQEEKSYADQEISNLQNKLKECTKETSNSKRTRNQELRQMEKEISDLKSKKFDLTTQLNLVRQEKLDTQKHNEELVREMTGLKRSIDSYDRTHSSSWQQLKRERDDLQHINHKLQEELMARNKVIGEQRMKQTQYLSVSSERVGSNIQQATSGTSIGSGSSGSDIDLARLYETHMEERRIWAMERLRLEKLIQNLQLELEPP